MVNESLRSALLKETNVRPSQLEKARRKLQALRIDMRGVILHCNLHIKEHITPRLKTSKKEPAALLASVRPQRAFLITQLLNIIESDMKSFIGGRVYDHLKEFKRILYNLENVKNLEQELKDLTDIQTLANEAIKTIEEVEQELEAEIARNAETNSNLGKTKKMKSLWDPSTWFN